MPRAPLPMRTGGGGVCLKGGALWGQTQSGYKAVGARCKIGCGGSHWRLGTRVGVVLGLRTCLRVDLKELKEERWGGGGGGGTPPLPSSKALGGGFVGGYFCGKTSSLRKVAAVQFRWSLGSPKGGEPPPPPVRSSPYNGPPPPPRSPLTQRGQRSP